MSPQHGRSPVHHRPGPDNTYTYRQSSKPWALFEGSSGPVELILTRLEGVKRAGRGWSARCPAHDDRWPSLSVCEGTDGRALAYCHSGCSFGDIMGALGLEVAAAFPPGESPVQVRPRKEPSPVALPRSIAEILVDTAEFAWTWEAAKILAVLEPTTLHQDVLRNWDYLTERFDLPLLLRTAAIIRGVAFLRYCHPRNAGDPVAVRRAVARLIDDLDRKARAA